jgi:hypothetical protein
MSMPMTCGGVGFQKRDVLFHVLFGGNAAYIRRLVEESVVNLSREYPGDSVAEALQLMRPDERDGVHHLQIRFFLLLNEDETMRRRLAVVRTPVVTGLCPYKAERFYDLLRDELVPSWIRACSVSHGEFVDRLREGYLCS